MKITDIINHKIIEAHDEDEDENMHSLDGMNFDSLLNKYMDDKKLWNIEGRAGLTNLAAICSAIGYKDPNYFGQLSREASIGDLVNFLEDNSGAIEAIIEFIKQEGDRNDDWQSSLRDYILE